MHLFKTGAIALLFSGQLVLAFTSFTQADEARVNFISTTGTGSESTAPDMALLSVGIIKEEKTARKTLDNNNSEMASVLKALKQHGIADKDLQTSGFNIQPRYHYPKRTNDGEQPAPRITGYSVTNNLDIRIRDLQKTGEILDLLVTLGMNSGGNIQFRNDDTTEIMKKARISAVKNAREKAETLADAAGVELGEILKITENSSQPRPLLIAQARSFTVQEGANSVPIASGENSYRVTVQIDWAIKQ